VVGEQWLARLDEGGLSQRFFAGAVTFATLMPMRAIPFRHVCLLGMNDGDYPRPRAPLDFDLMGRDYRPGDRSRREDDRYLVLEALLSARERLYISWVGRSVTDNSPRPPSVLVGQLRDHLSAGWRLAGETAEPLSDALTIEHPLQPFGAAYFPAEAAGSPLFTYAHEWRADTAPVADSAMLAPPQRDEPLSLRELAEFLRDPVKAFFRQRLQVAFEGDDPASDDVEPFELDGLDQWRLQDELIAAQATALDRGSDLAEARVGQLARIGRRGELAAGGFGAAMADVLAEPMENLFARYREALARWPQAIAGEEEIRLGAEGEGASIELSDWLGGMRRDGDGARGRVALESSSLIGGDNEYRGDCLIRHWVFHLAAHLAGGPVTTLVLSKRGEVELPPLTQVEAEAHLRALLRSWQQGMCRPLPVAVKSAFAWLKALPVPGDAAALDRAIAAARKVYEGDFNREGELANNPYLQRSWPSFDALYADGEFAALAEALLRPLQRAMHAKADANRQSKAGGGA
jgi:exodeoxyribonuclease V gamma subunit